MGKRYTSEPHNPAYPKLGGVVAKFRTLARGGLKALSYEDRRAYGEAVEKAILALQRSELQRELPSHKCNCASGTSHNDGEAIHEALRAKQAASLRAWPAKVRRNRTGHEWETMYAEAMADKRKREAHRLAA